LLLKVAKKIHANYLVTGHYSRIRKITSKNFKILSRFSGAGGRGDGNRANYELLRGLDESKDQSYFLYTLKQDELKHLLFPIGDYTKKEIREIAKKNHLKNWNKKSTVGICFVGKVNLKDFLKKKIKPKKGKILNPDGEVIGEHDGIYYYTIGQRLGMRYGFEINKSHDDKRFMKRWYVARKDVKKNILIAAPEGHPLNYRKEIVLKNVHWISSKPKNNSPVLARIRQVGELLSAKIYFGKKIKVILEKSITGVSEGQAIVLYSGKKVLGGGVIGFK
jgi:tRNA-specific 2-thiouridylase